MWLQLIRPVLCSVRSSRLVGCRMRLLLAAPGPYRWPSHARCCRGQGGGDLYIAFNAHGHECWVTLPQAPDGRRWCRVVDTNLPAPRDIMPGGNNGVDPSYGVAPFSSIILVAK